MALKRRELLKAGSAAAALMALPKVLEGGEAMAGYGDKGSPELDLREFLPVGFVIDGSVDYSGEMQKCLTAGKRIFIPAGTWLCENLNIRGYRNIRGAGRGNTVLKIPTGSSNFLMNCVDGQTDNWLPYSCLSDFSIDGNNSRTALGGIYAGYVTNWVFERIAIYDFHNPLAAGLWLDHAYQIAIRDCYVRMGSKGAGKRGQSCFKLSASTADPVHTTHITYDNCLAQYSGTGFLLAALGNRGGNMTIRQSASGNHDCGILIEDFYREVLIENTLIENTSASGVMMKAATPFNIHNVSLKEVTFYENTTAKLAGNVEGLSMERLRFAGDDAGGHTAFHLSNIKKLELGTYNVEGAAYDAIVAPGTIDPRITSLDMDDSTPTVAAGGRRHTFRTQSKNPTPITAFDDGAKGQEITVIFADSNTTIDFTATTLKGNGGYDFTGAKGDVMTGVFDGTNWYFQVHNNTP